MLAERPTLPAKDIQNEPLTQVASHSKKHRSSDREADTENNQNIETVVKKGKEEDRADNKTQSKGEMRFS